MEWVSKERLQELIKFWTNWAPAGDGGGIAEKTVSALTELLERRESDEVNLTDEDRYKFANGEPG